jgi:hypothetical protein
MARTILILGPWTYNFNTIQQYVLERPYKLHRRVWVGLLQLLVPLLDWIQLWNYIIPYVVMARTILLLGP